MMRRWMRLTNSSGDAAKKPRVLGRTEPRLFTPPLRELTPDTSLGLEAIETAELIGRHLYPWQKYSLIASLVLAPVSFFYAEFHCLPLYAVLCSVGSRHGS